MSKEVAVQEPEQSEITLAARRINEGLIAFETRKAELTELKENAEELKIESLEDKESITKVSTWRKKLKSARVDIQKEGKDMRDPLTKITKGISEKENELIAIIEPTEKALIDQEAWVKAEQDKIDQEVERKEQERIQARIDRLAKYGYAIDITFLRGIDDDQFEKVCDSARIEFEKDQSAKAEQARMEQEQRDQAEKDRLELKRLREKQESADRILKERQDELDRQAKALKDQQDEAEEKERKRVKAEADAEINRRIGSVTAWGLTFDLTDRHYKGFGVFIPIVDIQTHDKEKWDELVEKCAPVIDRAKSDQASAAQKQRLQDIEDARQKAIADEQERQRKAKEKSDEDSRLAEIARQEQLAKDGDKAIWADFIDRLSQVSVPTFRSGQYRKIAGAAREKIEEIQKLKP